MSVLTERPPSVVMVGEIERAVNPGHDNCLTIIAKLQSGERGDVMDALRLFYADKVPLPETTEYIDRMGWFLGGGDEPVPVKEPDKRTPRALDYTIDAELILAAFRSEYGIDLTAGPIHWWTFRALLGGIGDDQRLSQIMGYRTVNLSEIKDKRTRKRYKKLQRLYKLPDAKRARGKKLSPDEMAAKAASVFG